MQIRVSFFHFYFLSSVLLTRNLISVSLFGIADLNWIYDFPLKYTFVGANSRFILISSSDLAILCFPRSVATLCFPLFWFWVFWIRSTALMENKDHEKNFDLWTYGTVDLRWEILRLHLSFYGFLSLFFW